MAAEDTCAACGLMRREHQPRGAAHGRCGEFVQREEDRAWLILYDDADERPEVFTGHGAKVAAQKRFDMLRTHWNIHLFERIASA